MNNYEKVVEAVDAMLQVDNGQLTMTDFFAMDAGEVVKNFSKDRGVRKGKPFFHYLGLDISEMDNFLRKNGALDQEQVKVCLREHPHGTLRMLVDNLTEVLMHDEGLGLYVGYYEKALENANI